MALLDQYEDEGTVRRLSPGDHPLFAQLERCRAWLEAGLEGGFYTWEDLCSAIVHGRAYLWPGKNSAMVTQDEEYPSGERVMQVWTAGGDLNEILEMAPGVEAAARNRGCTAVLIEGRAGWARALKARGYEQWSVTVKKAL